MSTESNSGSADAGSPSPPSATERPPAERSRLRARAARVGKVALAAMAAYYALCLVLLIVYRFAAPPITGLQLQRCFESWLSGDRCRMVRRYVAYERLPRHVPRAVIAAEDGRFFRHWGFDLEEMKVASASIFDGEMPRGASTISQQLMKNLFGGTWRNPVRKLYDMTLTPPAELILGKERILELYLNSVEWGPGIYGIDAAARHHFGVGATSLSRYQAAALAALLPNPLRRRPSNTPQYRAEILRRMSVRGW